MDKYLTRREKYMYERILAEIHHQGSLTRLNASLVILQKIIKNQRIEKLKEQMDEEIPVAERKQKRASSISMQSVNTHKAQLTLSLSKKDKDATNHRTIEVQAKNDVKDYR